MYFLKSLQQYSWSHMLLLIKQQSVFPFSFEIELTFANVCLNELNVVEMTAYSQESIRVLPGYLGMFALGAQG